MTLQDLIAGDTRICFDAEGAASAAPSTESAPSTNPPPGALNDTDWLFPERTEAESEYMTSRGESVDALAKQLGFETDGDQDASASDGEEVRTRADGEGEDVEVDQDGEPKRDPKTGRFVPHGALHQERERRKAAEESVASFGNQLAERDATIAQLTERLARLEGASEALKKPTDPKDLPIEDQPDIDPADDFMGALQQERARRVRLEKQLSERSDKQDQQQTAATEAAQTASWFRDDMAGFQKDAPDFGDAYSFLANARAQEWMSVNGISEAEAVAEVRREARDLVTQAKKSGRSAARAIYDMAKQRGYQAKTNPNDASADEGSSSEEQEIARRAALRERAGSLSDMGGGGTPGEIDMATLAGMSEDDYAEYRNKNQKKVAAVLGRG